MSQTKHPLGAVTRGADGTYTLRFERRLSHPPERVWAAITDPAEASRWFMEMTVMEPRLGGRVHIEGEAFTEGEVLAWDPPRLLEYSWTERGSTSRVRWELTTEGDGTRLTLTHSGLAAAPDEYGAGWHDFLDRLEIHVDGDDMPALGDGWPAHREVRYESLLDAYRAIVPSR